MPNPSSISRRIQASLECAKARNYEESLIHFFPALDKTAKRRRPKAGVGELIRAFVADYEGIISAVATRNFIRNISADGVSFPDAIYKFGRTSIAHEGELDPRLTFNDTAEFTIGQVWNLPSSYILALCVAVMLAPENAHEFINTRATLVVCGRKFAINDLWGAQSEVERLICEAFRDPHLFDRIT